MNGKLDSSLLGKFGIDGPGGSNIKSIQRGVATYNATTWMDITINPVDLTKAVVVLPYTSANGNSPSIACFSAVFMNSTTIRISSYASTTDSIDWLVIEFNNVKSLQNGSYNWSTGTGVLINNSVTIANVDISKSLIFVSHVCSSTTGGVYGYYTCTPTFTNSTTINLKKFDIAGTIKWQVVEFS